MAKDFRASQVETSKLIASGGITGTKAGLATTGYMVGSAAGKKTMKDKQRVANSGGVGASEGVDEDMEIFGVDREKYAKMSDQEKKTIKRAYRAKKAVSK